MSASGGLMGKVGIKARDFQGFLPKLESINQLILYKANSLFSSHAIISASIYCVGSFLNNSLYNDLAIVYFCCFYIYIPYFRR